MSAQGFPLTHHRAQQLSQKDDLVLVCGHYEGVDERFIQLCVDEEISIGDFVMTGGEIPAMALVDSVVRLIPGVLGGEDSAKYDSFASGSDSLLEGPVYTRPANYQGLRVPEILLSGARPSQTNLRQQCCEQSSLRTYQRRCRFIQVGSVTSTRKYRSGYKLGTDRQILCLRWRGERSVWLFSGYWGRRCYCRS